MQKNIHIVGIALFVMMLIVIVTTGCDFRTGHYREIEKYLKAKYDYDKFTELQPYYGKLFPDGPVYELNCKSKLHPEFPITGVYIETIDTFYDNYMSVVYAEQFDQYVEETILKELFGEGNYNFLKFNSDDRSLVSEYYTKDMTFEEFLPVAPSYHLIVMADAATLTDEEAFQEALTDRVEESGIAYDRVDVYFMEPFNKAVIDGDITQIQVKHKDVVCLLKGEKTEGEFEYTWEYYAEDHE